MIGLRQAAALAVCLLLARPVAAQDAPAEWQPLLRRVLPSADRFTDRQGSPPVFHAYRMDGSTGQSTLVGYAFLTSDVPPEEMGYSGPIEVLVGMDLTGTLTGVVVTRYNESLRRSVGDFLSRPGFQEQFAGKGITDPFQVKRDVNGVTGASITSGAVARGIRNAARRVAVALRLGAASVATEAPLLDPAAIRLAELERLSWTEMVFRELVQQLSVLQNGRNAALVYLMYLHDEAMAEMVVGPKALRQLRERAGDLVDERHLMLAATDGAPGLNLLRMFIVQDGDTTRFTPGEVLLLGPPREGKLNGQAQYIRMLLVDRAVDMTRPFTFVLDLRPAPGLFTAEYPGRREARPVIAAADVGTSGARGETGDRDAAVVADAGTGAGVTEAGRRGGAPVAADPPPGESATGGAAAGTGVSSAAASPSRGDGAAGGAGSSVAAPAADAADGLGALELFELNFSEDEEDTVASRLFAGASWPRVAALAVLLGLAATAFGRKRVWPRRVTLAATIVFLGFYSKGFLSVSHITAGLKVGPEVYIADLSVLLLVTFTVVTTLLWGRVFCGYLCPFGVLQDFLDRVVPRRLRRQLPERVHGKAQLAKYGVLAVIVFPAAAGAEVSVFQYFEPFGTVFFPSRSLLLWAIAGAILIACAAVPRFYCRYMCPLGAALALGSLASPFRIRRVEQCTVCKVCEKACPTGAITGARVNFKECVRCNVCEIKLIEKAGVCRHEMAEVRSRLIKLKTSAAAASRP